MENLEAGEAEVGLQRNVEGNSTLAGHPHRRVESLDTLALACPAFSFNGRSELIATPTYLSPQVLANLTCIT